MIENDTFQLKGAREVLEDIAKRCTKAAAHLEQIEVMTDNYIEGIKGYIGSNSSKMEACKREALELEHRLFALAGGSHG